MKPNRSRLVLRGAATATAGLIKQATCIVPNYEQPSITTQNRSSDPPPPATWKII